MKIKLIDFGTKYPPKRQHYNDAGADVFSPRHYVIEAGHTGSVPLGFGLEIPDGCCGFIFVRSSMAKMGIDCKLPPIDSGYRGQVHAMIYNGSGNDFHIAEGERIGQLVILPCVIADFTKDLGEERGEGAFGSTGK